MAFSKVEDVFNGMANSFNPSNAQGLDAVFQYNITGAGGGNWNVVVKDGACQVNTGSHPSPNVTLSLDAETWLGMVNKQINGMQAFMSGKLRVSGDIMLAQKMESLFSY
ncbi:MAG: SCP2 sterol-binding domain-containing protein [Deltaproteobacteria bacterium]|nr:SCP2 sterol-binding domain-containing protein [Deltaproteobacteria bacterium]